VVTVNNPAPRVTSLDTRSVPEGSGTFTLTLAGSGFVPASTVQWNGTPLAVTALNATQIQVTVPASALTDEGTAMVTVSNPGPGGGTSVPQLFTIADATLTASALNLSVTGNKNFSGVVATFTDANPNAVAAEFKAIITWDDGTAAYGTIGTVSGTSTFTVSGSHNFSGFKNVHIVTVTIFDKGGSTATVADNVIDPPGKQGHHHKHHSGHSVHVEHRHRHRPAR
jgi:hypothetical protein